MFKNIIETFIKARAFENSLKLLNLLKIKRNKKTYKVQLTEEQMDNYKSLPG